MSWPVSRMEGPGWQDRINEALRKGMPAPADQGLKPEDLNSSMRVDRGYAILKRFEAT